MVWSAHGSCEHAGAGDGGNSKVVMQAVHTYPCPGLASWRQVANHFFASLPMREGAQRYQALLPRFIRVLPGIISSCIFPWYLASYLGILHLTLVFCILAWYLASYHGILHLLLVSCLLS